MCGINGFNFQDKNLIERMNQALQHRGPDDEGVFLGEHISLGHRRLAIIDLSEKGRQPIFNEDKSICLIFNGEIYNFKNLRNDLEKKGHRFFSQTDSEVILHLYEDGGEKCLEKLNGIFAFAIWDNQQKKLFLARDRVGVKPLYYFWNSSRFIFSSEIKAILEHSIKRRVNLEAFNHYFRMQYAPAPLTMFEGIYKLSAGYYLIYQNNKVKIESYWQPRISDEVQSEEQAIEQIQELIKESVKGQLISDRPLGIYLSGGLDSTSVLGLANELTGRQIKTFSVGFDIEPEKFNADFELARKTSQYYNTEHNELIITGQDVRDNLEQVVYHLDEPISNVTQTATFLLSKFAKKQVAVVLGGDGGDELFGGYLRYAYSRLISQYQKIPAFLRKSFLSFLIQSFLRRPVLNKKLNLPPGAERYLSFMAQKEEFLNSVLRPSYNQSALTPRFYQEKYFKEVWPDFEKQFMWTDVKTWLVDESLMRTDKMTMAFGLEERVPILDHRLVELSLRLPTKYKIQGRETKHIFKKAMKKYLPDYLLNQPKRGWFSPAAKWLRNDLKDLAYEVLSENYCPATKEYFDFKRVRKNLDLHIEKKRYDLITLWALIMFQMWYKRFEVGN